jgi:hypothetical protein
VNTPVLVTTSTVPKSAGWVVELLRCDHLDDSAGSYRWFCVNLIAPQGGTTSDWTREKPVPPIPSDIVLAGLAELIFPWRWSATGASEWRLFGQVRAGDPWVPIQRLTVDAGTKAVDASGAAALCTLFEQEVTQRSKGCEDAFNRDNARWHGHPNPDSTSGAIGLVEQSLVHALAPPTHTPAALSNSVFRYAGFIKLAAADYSKYENFAAFPVFAVGSSSYEPADVQGQDTLVATYNPPAINATTLVFQSYAVAAKDNKLQDLSLSISAGSPARDVVAPLFASHGLPLEALANAIARIVCTETLLDGSANPDWPLVSDAIFPQNAWLHVLVVAIGSGWLRRRSDGTRPHLLDYAATGSDLANRDLAFPNMKTAFADPASEGDSAAWLMQFHDECRQLAPRGAVDPLMLAALEKVLESVKPLPASAPDRFEDRRKQAQQFFKAWATLAQAFLGDGRAAAYRVWMAMRIRYTAAQTSDAAKAAVAALCERLNTLVSADSVDRMLLGNLDRGGVSGVWKLLGELVNANEDATLEKAAIAQIRAWCSASAATMLGTMKPPAAMQEMLDAAMLDLLTAFGEQGHRLVRRNYDAGLPIRFDGNETTSDIDARIRGFAIALRSGVRDANDVFWADTANAAWVTQTAVLSYAPDPAKPGLLRWQDTTVAQSPGTVGSASRDGQRVVQFAYLGDPVFAAGPGGADDDDFHSLDYRWLSGTPLPALGFGCEVQGICTAIDNAGGVVTAACRDAAATAKPADQLGEALWSSGRLTYRSCVPPGAPKLLTFAAGTAVDPFELSDETRASRYAGQLLAAADALPDDKRGEAIRRIAAGGALPQVACIATSQLIDGSKDKPLYRNECPRSIDITLAPPTTAKTLVRAWLATDQLVARAKLADFSDDNFGKVPLAELERFVGSVTDLRDRNGRPAPESDYHPAVDAIGIEFDFGTRFNPILVPAISLRRTQIVNGTLQLAPEQIGIRVTTDLAADKPQWKGNGLVHELLLPPGCFVRLRCYALVQEVFFTGKGSWRRFFDGLTSFDATAFGAYRGFGPYELWIEALPRWEKKTLGEARLPLEVAGPKSLEADRQRLLLRPPAGLRADWIRALTINRHAWHWVGYPVQFPEWRKGEDLKSWLPAFAGVESNREQISLELPTRVEKGDWLFGETAAAELVLHEHRLRAGERPSQYAAYTVRIVARFGQWLNPALTSAGGGPRDLENPVAAAANVIGGMGAFDETQRLPAPAFEHRIPLTASYEYSEEERFGALPLGRSVNGNLLIFNDAMRRTDSFARAGGLGDTIEVDVLQTRRVATTGTQPRAYAQIGPNPIFHKAPAASGGLPADFTRRVLKVSEPHGLTYDLVRNAKVVQTAVLVRPAMRSGTDGTLITVDDAPTEWQMAQVRVRRLILPETQLNAAIAADVSTGEYPIPWRSEGVERVPFDFAVDVLADETPTLELNVKQGTVIERHALVVPKGFPAKAPARLLVSFHKGRWDPAKPAGLQMGLPYWAAQVQMQQRAAGSMAWTTISTETCHGKDPWTVADGTLSLSIGGAQAPTIHRVQASDYTDARWLLFIGRIPGTGKQPPEEYRLVPDASGAKLRLRLARGTFGRLPGPPQKKADWEQVNDDVEFFVLLVNAPAANVMAGKSGGARHGLLAFRPSKADANGNTTEFEIMGEGDSPTATDLTGSAAVLYSFQRITATSSEEREVKITSLVSLLNAIFPEDAEESWHARESTVRPTGNHWGPIAIHAPI